MGPLKNPEKVETPTEVRPSLLLEECRVESHSWNIGVRTPYVTGGWSAQVRGEVEGSPRRPKVT